MDRKRPTLRARAWRVMRMMMWWSIDDLLFTVADGTEKEARKNLRRYVHMLAVAGYLDPHPRFSRRWRLIRDTGLEAPTYNTKTKKLTDSNTGEVFDVL